MKIESLREFQKTKVMPAEWLKIPNQANVTINRECNLRCKHCDLPPEFEESGKELSPDGWKKFVNDFAVINNNQKKVIAIASREPLFDKAVRQKTAAVLQASHRLNNVFAGFVTNGHYLPEFLQEYPDIKTDYMDVSLEGDERLNDKIRGQGSFKKAVAGLKLAIEKKLAPKIFLASTMTDFNTQGNSITNFINLANGWGVENFIFHTLIPGRYVKNGLQIKDKFFLNLIPQFEKMAKKIDGQIVIDAFPQSFDNFENVIAEILPSMDLFLDASGYLVGEWKNSNKLFFRFFNILWALIVFFVVTPEGFIITPVNWRSKKYLSEKLEHIQGIVNWKKNPNKKAIEKLLKKIPEKCFDKQSFIFCLGQNNRCPIYQ
ncbi:radical SAM protein [Candidatus Parcubacteria bacterium]|nr:radical SAM protein [Candidatus Parcubacteria bacterium]